MCYSVFMKEGEFEIALRMRKDGYSYSLIQEEVSVAKSTLSRWLKDVPYIPNQEVRKRIGNARAAAGKAKHDMKLLSYQQARMLAEHDFTHINNKSLHCLGLGIYMGEGEKNDNVGLANSDPVIIKLFIRWLQECYGVGLEHLTASVHIYPDHDEQLVCRYWSSVTGISTASFGKTQIDRREKKRTTKYRKLPYGTVHVRVKSNGKKELGVLLSRRIEESITLLATAGVV